MNDRQWLGDVGLAVLLVLPTAALMWPSPSAVPAQVPLHQEHAVIAASTAHSQIEQRFGIKR